MARIKHPLKIIESRGPLGLRGLILCVLMYQRSSCAKFVSWYYIDIMVTLTTPMYFLRLIQNDKIHRARSNSPGPLLLCTSISWDTGLINNVNLLTRLLDKIAITLMALMSNLSKISSSKVYRIFFKKLQHRSRPKTR